MGQLFSKVVNVIRNLVVPIQAFFGNLLHCMMDDIFQKFQYILAKHGKPVPVLVARRSVVVVGENTFSSELSRQFVRHEAASVISIRHVGLPGIASQNKAQEMLEMLMVGDNSFSARFADLENENDLTTALLNCDKIDILVTAIQSFNDTSAKFVRQVYRYARSAFPVQVYLVVARSLQIPANYGIAAVDFLLDLSDVGPFDARVYAVKDIVFGA